MANQKGITKMFFAKSEKWLGPSPTPEVAKWVSRETEVSGFAEYLMQLSAWASQASLEFAAEIMDSSRWPEVIAWQQLSSEQRTRSTRLGILKTAFSTHARTAMLISTFCEGVDLHRVTTRGGEELWMRGQASNGFELLRQLTLEYSIKTRSEALSLRSMFSGKSFAVSSSESSATSIVSDTIRKIDLEVAKFSRLISTLPASVDTTGLSILEADLVVLLLRSLPGEVKTYCLHHTPCETYSDYKETARRWEHQQRLFLELPGMGQNKKVYELQHETNTEWYDMTETDNNDGWWYVDSMGSDKAKCSKCGSKKHSVQECTTDMTKVKCYRCRQVGHVSMNCPNKVVSSGQYGKSGGKDKGKGKQTVMKGDWMKGKGKDKGKGKGKEKGKDKSKGGKSKGKSFGKKGKMNEMVGETSNEDLWWFGDDSYWNDQWQYDVAQVWNSDWSGYDTSNAWDWNDPWSGQGSGQEHQSGKTDSGAAGSGKSGTEPAVESLMLSPLISEISFLNQTGLKLQSETCELQESLECFDDISVMCLEVKCQTGRFFCDCDVCMHVSHVFSQEARRAKRRHQVVESWLAGESWCSGELELLRCRGCGAVADELLCHCCAVPLRADPAVCGWEQQSVSQRAEEGLEGFGQGCSEDVCDLESFHLSLKSFLLIFSRQSSRKLLLLEPVCRRF